MKTRIQRIGGILSKVAALIVAIVGVLNVISDFLPNTEEDGN